MAVAAAAFTHAPNVELLSPVVALNFHPTNLKARRTGERFITAIHNVAKALNEYYTEDAFTPMLSCQPEFPIYRSFEVEGQIHEIRYRSCQDPDGSNRVFFAHLKGSPDEEICIKFVRVCGEEAHRFAAGLGIASTLKAVHHFEDGWIMVVMDVSSVYHLFERAIEGRDQAQLKKEMASQLCVFHEKGFVHGDIRSINTLLKPSLSGSPNGSSFVLLDFDWAGREGEARYSTSVNLVTLRRPDDVELGGLIKKEHDMQMLEWIFTPPPLTPYQMNQIVGVPFFPVL